MPKTPVQTALIQMRRKLNLTQQQLAVALKVGLPTVGRWESTRSPTGSSLTQLAAFAQEAGDPESAKIFHDAAFSEPIRLDLTFDEERSRGLAAAQLIRYAHLAAKHDPAVKHEYIKALRQLLRLNSALMDRALKAQLRNQKLTDEALLKLPLHEMHAHEIPDLLRAEQNLRKELNEQEGKKTKKKR